MKGDQKELEHGAGQGALHTKGTAWAKTLRPEARVDEQGGGWCASRGGETVKMSSRSSEGPMRKGDRKPSPLHL